MGPGGMEGEAREVRQQKRQAEKQLKDKQRKEQMEKKDEKGERDVIGKGKRESEREVGIQEDQQYELMERGDSEHASVVRGLPELVLNSGKKQESR